MSSIPERTAAVAVAALLTASCGSSHEDDVRRVADAFEQAVQVGDWPQACDRLAQLTRSELEQSAGTSCGAALAEETLPKPGRRTEVSVFGTNAQVRYSGETLFLARFDDSWRVVAAGCTAQRPKPYDCVVKGG